MKVAYINNLSLGLSSGDTHATVDSSIVATVNLPMYVGAFVADSMEELDFIRATVNGLGNSGRIIVNGYETPQYFEVLNKIPQIFAAPVYIRTYMPTSNGDIGCQEATEKVLNSRQVYLPQQNNIRTVAFSHNNIKVQHAPPNLGGVDGYSADGGVNWSSGGFRVGFIGGMTGRVDMPVYAPDFSKVYTMRVSNGWSSSSDPYRHYVEVGRANGNYVTVTAETQAVLQQLFSIKPAPTPGPSGDDPYTPGGTTGPGGGTGTHDPGSSDPIGFNMLPEVSAVGTGFLSLWSPTEQQMLDLSEYMWNANPLTLDFWRRLIADPIQLIYGLNIIPLSLYDAGLIGGTESVVVGMINTGIKMDYLTSQWVELDCGTIDIEETWGAYLDYDPYTKLDIYLPYIGYRPLRVDDFMPGVIHVKYKIDLLTGACCAQISSTKSNEHGDTLDSVIYQFTGNCATQIPVTATQYADAVRSAISLAAAIGTVALLAGAGAPAAGVAGASIMPGVDPVGLLNPPGMVPVDSELFGAMSQYNFMTAPSDAGAVLKSAGGTLKNVGMIHAGASAVENVMGIKPSVQRSGAIGGAAGMLGTQTPYLIFTRPRQAVPENQSTYTGYPSFMTKQLSELTGFTQIQSIHLEGIPCTANELAEIDALLKSGVIF